MLKSLYLSFFKRRSWFYNKLHHADLTNIHVKSTCLHSDNSSGRSAVDSTVSLNLQLPLSGFLLAVMVIIIVDMSSAHLLSLQLFAACWSNRSVYTTAIFFWHYPIWHNTGPSLMMMMYICHILEEWISQIPRRSGCGECKIIQISVISSTPADTLWGRW